MFICKKQRGYGFIFLVSLWLMHAQSQAALDLELTRGVNRAIPIAVLPFVSDVKAKTVGTPKGIAGVIQADLHQSGRFRLWNTSAESVPALIDQLDFNVWRKRGVNNIVVGRVRALGGGRYQVNVQLLDVYGNLQAASKKRSGPNWQKMVLVDKHFVAKKFQLRRLAHHISDVIYEKLLGKPGFFTTQMAYVLVQYPARGVRQYSLMLADIDGYHSRPLLKSRAPLMSPAWSPDAKNIAYVSFEGGRAAIYTQNIRTGKRRRVAHYPGINGAPAWSPNGRQLALVLSETGYPKIYILNMLTHRLKQITQGWSIDTEPRWSPDGKTLIFTSNRGGGPQIYRLAFKNGQASGQPERLSYVGSYNASASFTRDGRYLVMLNKGGDGRFNIVKQDLETGEVRLLTRRGHTQSPSLAPNDDGVLYAFKDHGRQLLGRVSMDGRVSVRLPATEGQVREPVWSPIL